MDSVDPLKVYGGAWLDVYYFNFAGLWAEEDFPATSTDIDYVGATDHHREPGREESRYMLMPGTSAPGETTIPTSSGIYWSGITHAIYQNTDIGARFSAS